jgi:hypothetical protein
LKFLKLSISSFKLVHLDFSFVCVGNLREFDYSCFLLFFVNCSFSISKEPDFSNSSQAFFFWNMNSSFKCFSGSW